MKFGIFYLLFASLTIFTISPVEAAIEMKPGLWEHSFTIKSQSGKVEKGLQDMKKQLEQMPADQRQMMEEMMAKQGVGLNAQNSSVKICITGEQAKNFEIPQVQNETCTQEVVKRSANSLKMKFTCTGNPVSNGEGEFTLTSPTAYTGKSIINTTIDEKPDRMDMDQKGKWLSSNCGKIESLKSKN